MVYYHFKVGRNTCGPVNYPHRGQNEKVNMSSLPSRIKAIWNTYGIEIAKFCTVGGAAFVVNSVVVWTLMVTIMHDSHTKAKVIASIVATIFSWLMNRLWTFRENRSENWKR